MQFKIAQSQVELRRVPLQSCVSAVHHLCMSALRSRRLEQLLGGPIDVTLSYEQVKGLIPNIAEGPDLDFKRDTYSSSDKDRKSLCGDIGALCNANGGLLILGMDEDDQGRAANDTGVDISDAEQRRLRQTVYGNIQPSPTFGIIPVEDPHRPGVGFLVIWVARSVNAPHAYVAQNKSLLFPKRIGTETVWLSEAEVADAYRARFAGFADRIEEADRIEAELTARLSTRERFVVVTLVPDLPGDFTINTATLREFQLSLTDRQFGAFGIQARSFMRAAVRRRRLIATASWKQTQPVERGAAELHSNGSGAFATNVDARVSGTDDPPHKLVDDQWLTLGIGTGLQFLASHARDRAAAGGLATVRATLWPVHTSVVLVSNIGWPNEQLGTEFITTPPTADTVADIDDLATGGPGLVSATHRLATELFQAFGVPENAQVTADGKIRLPHWHRSAHGAITSWAQATGVEVLTETLA